MNTTLKIGLSTLLLVFAELSQAQNIGQVGYGGNGCPADTAKVAVDDAENTVTLQLAEMQTLVGEKTEVNLERKACAIAVPVKVPKDMKVESVQALYLGAAAISELAVIDITSEHFIAGSRGKVNKITLGTTEGFSFGFAQKAHLNTSCGEDISLRANFAMLARTDAGDPNLSVGILDQVQYKINFVACN